MSRRRIRSVEYRARRQTLHAGRHYFIDEPLPGGGEPAPYLAGSRVTEYRRGVIVSVDIDPGAHADGVSIKRSMSVPS